MPMCRQALNLLTLVWPCGRCARSQREGQREKFTAIVRDHVRNKLFWAGPEKKKKKTEKKKKQATVAPTEPEGTIAEAADAMEEGVERVDEAAADAAATTAEPASKESTAAEDGDEEQGGEEYFDDLVSQVDIETYVQCRVRPLVEHLEKRAPTMSKRFNLCEGLGLLANTAGAVLSIVDLADWVAITVSIASVMMAVNDYFYIPAQLAATNRALQDAHNLITYWDSLSLVQRKTPSVKLRCATTMETGVLALCAARTAVSPALPSEAVQDDEEEEKK